MHTQSQQGGRLKQEGGKQVCGLDLAHTNK